MEKKELLQRYLLGDLSRSDQEQVEKECLANDALNEALQEAENDLIDAYVCQELSGERHRQFERVFLDSPERREQVEFARMLMSSRIRENVPVGPAVGKERAISWWRSFPSLQAGFAVATAAAMILTAASLLVQNRRLRNELDQSILARAELQSRFYALQQQEAHTLIEAPRRVVPSPSASPANVAVLLRPVGLRSSGGNRSHALKIPSTASSVILLLTLSTAGSGSKPEGTLYSRYDVVVQTLEGSQLLRLQGLNSRRSPDGGKMVSARVPSRLLTEGDYIVVLLGRSGSGERAEIDSYSLSVIR